jgi:hypothetical protein
MTQLYLNAVPITAGFFSLLAKGSCAFRAKNPGFPRENRGVQLFWFRLRRVRKWFYVPRRRNPFEVFDGFLLSYDYWQDIVPKCAAIKSKTIVGDSGGFSVASRGSKIDPEWVIRWQLEHTTIGYILDIPPYLYEKKNNGTSKAVGSTKARFAPELWNRSLLRTVRNVTRARRHYDSTRTDFRWWGVIQGQTREQQEEWYHAVAEVYPFNYPGEGWAMRPHPNNDPESVAQCVRFAVDKRITRLHLLQTTGARAVGLLLALAKLHGLDFVTYDSQTAGILGHLRTAIARPDSLPVLSVSDWHVKEISRNGETAVRDYMLSGKCDCVGCRWFREDEIQQGREYDHYIMMHNYAIMRDNFAGLEAWADRDPEQLLRKAAGDKFDAVMQAAQL